MNGFLHGKNYYIIEEETGQMIRFRPDIRPVGNPNELWAAMSNGIGMKLTHPFEVDGLPCTVTVKQGDTAVLGIELENVMIRSAFTVTESYMYPTYKHSRDTIDAMLDWPVPDNMRLFLGAELLKSSRWSIITAVLFAIVVDDNGNQIGGSETGGFWQLPLPNQHGDGRLCLGNGQGTVQEESLLDMAKAIKAYFQKSVWNGEGAPAANQTARVFRFSHNEEPIHEKQWWKQSKRINHPLMTEAVIL